MHICMVFCNIFDLPNIATDCPEYRAIEKVHLTIGTQCHIEGGQTTIYVMNASCMRNKGH